MHTQSFADMVDSMTLQPGDKIKPQGNITVYAEYEYIPVKVYQNDDLKPTPTYISPCMFLVTKAESTLS